MKSGTNNNGDESQRVGQPERSLGLLGPSHDSCEMADLEVGVSSCSSNPVNKITQRQESFGTMGSVDSWRRGSIRLSRGLSLKVLEDIEDQKVAQAGDDGYSRSSSLKFDVNELQLIENGDGTLPIDVIAQINGFGFHDASLSNDMPATSPLASEIISPLSTDPVLYSTNKDPNRSEMKNLSGPITDNQKRFPQLETVSCLLHLAVFGILGVLARYLLQKLFGPAIAGFTSNGTALYLDLPSNLAGSFLMGWLGLVFKGNISHVSDLLAVGLTTGFLGSLTTFSGWNQKMLELAADGKWVPCIAGYLIGLGNVYFAVAFGVWTANGFKWLLMQLGVQSQVNWKSDNFKRHIVALFVLLLMLALLWGVSVPLLKDQLEDDESSAQLWLACIVGPLGVWARWFLARINGRGLGKNGSLKWVPFGTFLANVPAAFIMAALATTKKEVGKKKCDIIVDGFQLGFLGCLSTVSTFVAELYAMVHSKYPWRAIVYAALTIIPSFILGTLIYLVPVWTGVGRA